MHAVCACAYRNSVKFVNVYSMLTLIVARRTAAASEVYHAGRDLEDSLLKGRGSRLKQYTSLQSYYDGKVSIIGAVFYKATGSVLNMISTGPCACMCSTVPLTAISY